MLPTTIFLPQTQSSHNINPSARHPSTPSIALLFTTSISLQQFQVIRQRVRAFLLHPLFARRLVVSAGSLSDRRPFGHPKSSDNRASVFSPLVRRHRLAVITAKVRIAEIGQQPRFRPQEHCSEKHSAKDHSLYLHQNSLVKVVLSFGYVFDIVLLSKNV